ncbi:MAG: amidohydrolase family protein [Proteobacteria bacterium]|nr:amidohydrolase family protein [Pseudomonadota bacterium]
MNRITLLATISALALSAAALAQPVNTPAKPASVTAAPLPPGPTPILIRHGHIYTVGAAGTLSDGDVLIENGKITAVGPNLVTPPTARVIDAGGKPVTPGLMASYTQLGIVEVELVSETNDNGPGQDLSAFDSDDDTASGAAEEKIASSAFDVVDAINPTSTLIPIARLGGVTRALTAPAVGRGVFYGHGAIIDLGKGPDLVEKTKAGMVVSLSPPGDNRGQPSRPLLWAKFREMMDDAREYLAQRAGYHRPGGARDQRPASIDLDALEPVIHGREPLIVHVDRASDIRQVVQYGRANNIRIIILGGEEAWKVASDLAAAQVPVIVDAEQNLPGSFSTIGATLANAARLDAAGVTVIFQPQSDEPAHYARTLAQIAGNAVANGMPWDHALAAITRKPAEVWGIADRYGTLEVGKDADVVVWDGDPLEVTSAPKAVFIKGVAMPLVSRQTMLRDRYKNLNDKSKPFAYR